MNNKEYPPYYKLVNIVFINKNGDTEENVAWLSWSEKFGYIWTIENSDTIILDKDVIKIM